MVLKYLHALNNEQLEAVTCNTGPLLVIAGAGSGKTRVITSKIAYLLREKGVAPSQILAVTFTNRAAAEMKKRVVDLIGHEASDLWVMTFHSACLRILRHHIDHLEHKANFLIYNAGEQKTLIKNVIKELRLPEDDLDPGMVLGRISMAKNRMLDPERFEAEAVSNIEKHISQIYFAYQKQLLYNNAMDFDDLLFKTINLWEKNPEICARYRHRFRAIMIDEYQDTNTVQNRLALNLYPPNSDSSFTNEHHLCVVGDEDQTIYQWRGADINNIFRFQEDYPDARTIKLEQNYRSTKTILSASNQVISHNKRRFGKNLWTDNDVGSTIVTYLGPDEVDEARYITRKIASLGQEEEVRLSDCAIFYRIHAQSRIIEEHLREQNIPYRIVGGTKFYDRREIKDIVAYLRLLTNNADQISLERIINVPRRGIGETTINRVREHAAAEECPLYTVIRQITSYTDITKRSVDAICSFRSLIDRYGKLAAELPISELVQQLVSELGFLDTSDKEDAATNQSRLENIGELITSIKELEESRDQCSLTDFLEHISLQTDSLQTEVTEEFVTLMTLHNAKGLEYPHVFITGMEEGVFPYYRAFSHPEEMEEERRLCYVGMTRAKERIYLTSCVKRRLYGKESYNPTSRFLREIDPIYLSESPFSVSAERRSRLLVNSGTGKLKQEFKQGVLQVGQIVSHPRWGTGKVRSVIGSGPDSKIIVNFQANGVKKLIFKFANLEQV